MKTIVLLSFLLAGFIGCSSLEKNTKSNAVQLVINGMHGTGYYLTIKNKNYIITNAHVCFGSIYSDVLLGRIYVRPNAKFHYQAQNIKYSTPLKGLKINVFYDLCLIPTKKGDHFPLAESKVGEKIFYHTFTKRGLAITKKGVVLSNEMRNLIIRTPKISFVHKEAIHLSTKTVPGESGSVVFNEKKEVVGVIFANRTIGNSRPSGFMVSAKHILKLVQ